MVLVTGMTAPLAGIRVLEVANWLAAPAAGALLADLGADVIKVEPPGGDVFREFLLRSMGYTHDFATNYAFQLDNRGKRSVTVALDQPGGPELVRRLAARSDVFLTNLIQQRRLRYGLTWEDVRAASPRVVYASFSGYGTRGPDENRPGFDYAAFWARSGLMGLLGEPPSPPPLCRGGQGDHTTALNILAAVLAALRLRDQTNEAQHCEVTLQATGMWTLAVSGATMVMASTGMRFCNAASSVRAASAASRTASGAFSGRGAATTASYAARARTSLPSFAWQRAM